MADFDTKELQVLLESLQKADWTGPRFKAKESHPLSQVTSDALQEQHGFQSTPPIDTSSDNLDAEDQSVDTDLRAKRLTVDPGYDPGLPLRGPVGWNVQGMEISEPSDPLFYGWNDKPVDYQHDKEFWESLGRAVGLNKADGDLSAPAPVRGAHITAPHNTYEEGCRAKSQRTSLGNNVWIRQSQHPHNANRTLMVQFSSNLLQTQAPGVAENYYDKLYKSRPGYHRPADFWELPQWQAHMAKDHPNADSYVVRDPVEAKHFIQSAGYGNVAFSAMDVNHRALKSLVQDYQGNVAVGGAINPAAFADMPNVHTHPTIQHFTESQGMQHQNGYDYRHFSGTRTIPRLTLSAGCLHNCSFCCVPKKIDEKSKEEVMAQADAFAAHLPADLIYINDKTFGQAKNHELLPEVYQRIKAKNPDFKGFIVQTTAAQMNKLSPEFLKAAGISHVELGVESYNNHILRSAKKPATEAIIDSAAQKLRGAGVNMIPNILVGLPGEDANSYNKTLGWLEKNRDIVSHVNAYNLAVYKDAPLANVLASLAPGDSDENVQAKSFHTNPGVHEQFHGQLFDWANRLLDEPRGLAKAWPRDEKENQINAMVHPVMEDALLEQGAKLEDVSSDRSKVSGVSMYDINNPESPAARTLEARRNNETERARSDLPWTGEPSHSGPISMPYVSGWEPHHDTGGYRINAFRGDRDFWRSVGGAARRAALKKADGDLPPAEPTDLPQTLAAHHIFSGKPYGIVTAQNPHYPVRAEAAGGNPTLESRMTKQGLKYSPVAGNYGADEQSYVVYNPTLNQMQILGKEFGQESVVYGANGEHQLHYTNGPDEGAFHPTVPGRAINYFAQRPGSYWTEIPGGGGFFNINVDWNSKQRMPRPSANPMIMKKALPTEQESKTNSEVHAVLDDYAKERGKVIATGRNSKKLVADLNRKILHSVAKPGQGQYDAAESANISQFQKLGWNPTDPVEPARYQWPNESGFTPTQRPKNQYGASHIAAKVFDREFWASLNKSWPKDEAENQANIQAHLVTQDLLQGRGKVLPHNRRKMQKLGDKIYEGAQLNPRLANASRANLFEQQDTQEYSPGESMEPTPRKGSLATHSYWTNVSHGAGLNPDPEIILPGHEEWKKNVFPTDEERKTYSEALDFIFAHLTQPKKT